MEKQKIKFYYQATCTCGWQGRRYLSPHPASHYGYLHEGNAKGYGIHSHRVNEIEVVISKKTK